MMESIFFGPFCLDPANGRLMRDGQAKPITPKAFAVLQTLLQRPGMLITKAELLEAVWPRGCVGDGVLKVCIRELRQALGDESKQPRFIETAHRRGYRFVAGITGVQAQLAHRFDRGALMEAPGSVPNERNLSSAGDRALSGSRDVGLLGRQRELDQLEASLRNAFQGERQLVLVTGEVGIGKSTLIEAFLRRATGTGPVCVARGHAFEHWINDQEYAPVIDALQGLCRDPQGARPLDHLRRWAPTWLLEIPSVVKPEERTLPEPRQRRFAEIADFVEAVTSEQPMILVLEDLHWSDHATVDLISYLAHRQSPAAFMLIGSYRSNEVITKNHPVKALVHELKTHKACVELPLEGLSELAVRELVAKCIPDSPLTAKVAQILYDQTEGNPLFMLEMMDHWIENDLFKLLNDAGDLSDCLDDIRFGIPDAIRELVNRRFDLLPAYDRHVLEAASITALKFSAEAVAALLDEDVVAVEECCEHLAHQQQFVYSISSTRRPERRGASRYAFIHWLYKQIILLGVPIARRTQLYARNKRSAAQIRAKSGAF